MQVMGHAKGTIVIKDKSVSIKPVEENPSDKGDKPQNLLSHRQLGLPKDIPSTLVTEETARITEKALIKPSPRPSGKLK
jgi:hypothetical protein